MRLRRFAKGEVIIRQGETGERLLIVSAGSVDVLRIDEAGEERNVATLGVGGFFGEHALLVDQPRNATCVVATEVEVYMLDKASFSTGLR